MTTDLSGEKKGSRRQRSPYFWVGCGLVAVGLAMLAWVAWELVGTNVIAHQRQGRLVQELREEWRTLRHRTTARGHRPLPDWERHARDPDPALR